MGKKSCAAQANKLEKIDLLQFGVQSCLSGFPIFLRNDRRRGLNLERAAVFEQE